jgi:uncharacterized membrane protein YjgN (DUF898 family)
MMVDNKRCHFDDLGDLMERYSVQFVGKGSEFAILIVKNLLLTILTLGIYHFWGKVEVRKFLWQHTVFHGHRFAYTGNGLELFLARLKLIGFLIALVAVVGGLGYVASLIGGAATVVFGIFTAVVYLLFYFVLLPFALVSSYRFRMSRTTWCGIQLGVLDCTKEYIKTFAIGGILTLLTIGIYSPILMADLHRILANNTRAGTLKFRFNGDGKDLLMTFIICFLLVIPTLGISMFWWSAKYHTYILSKTFMGNEADGFAQGDLQLTGGEIFVQFLVSFVIIMLTLGLAFPWILVRNLQWMFAKVSFNGDVNFDAIKQDKKGMISTLGDGIGDALDLGLT